MPEATDKIVVDEKAEPAARTSLVPVVSVSSSHALGNEVAGGAGIRRLPPVEAAPSRDSAQLFNGSIPIYPTTGIE